MTAPDSSLPDARHWLGREMTREDAELVRLLREGEDRSWRSCATEFFVRTEGVDRWDGNQICGMDLHYAAMELLSETWE
jgi:hypothetical protein